MHTTPRLLPAAAAAFLLGAIATDASAALIHRFSFNDGAAKDSVGKIEGRLVGPGASIAGGQLVLKNDSGATGANVSHLEFTAPVLPKNGTSVTLVVWFTAQNIGSFARVLNFGASEGTEGYQFIYFSPAIVDGNARIAITGSDVGSKTNLDPAGLDDGRPHCVAIVIDGAAKKLRVFVDGQEPLPAADLGDNTLDKVRPVENWIGRSSFAADPGLTGSIDEFRVYDHAFTPAEAAAVQRAGPNALPAAADMRK